MTSADATGGAAPSTAQLSKLLCDEVEPIARIVIRRTLRCSLDPTDGSTDNHDGLELVSEVLARILVALRSRPETIESLPSFTATVAFNVCHDHLRRRHPERARLRSKLRYLCSHHADLESEVTPSGIRISWRHRLRDRSDDAAWRDALAKALAAMPHGVTLERPAAFTTVVCATLRASGGAIDLDALVDALADHLPIATTIALDDARIDPATSRSHEIDHLARRETLTRLWPEICALPARQRTALLLSLRDEHGRECLTLFPIAGVATVAEVAERAGLSPETLAALVPQLPLDDKRIGELLDATRQQVINLRKSARARIARRRAAW